MRALEWDDVDLAKGTIKVRKSVRLGRVGTGKSKASETSPRKWSPYLNENRLNIALEASLHALKLDPMTFYEVGRHSFASDWAIQGRSIYELSKVMGHFSVTVTERYAHLQGSVIEPLL